MPWPPEGASVRRHPVTRLLLFLAGTAAVTIVLADALAALLEGTSPGRLTGLALPHAVLAVAALAVSLSLYRWWDEEERPSAALGLRLSSSAGATAFRWVGLGAVLIAISVLVQLALGWLEPVGQMGGVADWLGYMTAIAATFAVGSASEELLFRGYGFQRLIEWLGAKPAVLIQGTVFGALHAGNPQVNVLALLNIGLAGVLLGGAYLRTGSLWAAIGLHWSWNWFTALFDRPISGIELDVPGYDFRELGPDLLTGGSFGPEGGLLSTLILTAAIALVFATMRGNVGVSAVGGEDRG